MAGLYAHIPFCHSKCAYCDFYSMPRATGHAEFFEALMSEFLLRSTELTEPIKTVYIGGGTPSIVDAALIQKFAECILSSKSMGKLEEFTIEANPEDVTRDKVASWRQGGIDRISMGVQSFDDAQLSLIGRRHSSFDALRAVEIIRNAGIVNFSLDLIYGLPSQSLDSWIKSLEQLFELKPTHFSAYMLTYEPRTRLTAMLKSGKIAEASESLLIEMYQALICMAKEKGYKHYEISNFALPGFEARHNSSYWHNIPYLGLGPGAHSYDGTLRRINPANLKEYIGLLNKGLTAYYIDDEDADNRFNDLVITNLRTAQGLDLSLLAPDRLSRLMRDAEPYLAASTLQLADNHLIIPETAWLISDSILTDLMQI